jgi:hypothetical protein
MDPTSKRNLVVNISGPLLVGVMIVPVGEKSQIICWCLLSFLAPSPKLGLLTNSFLLFGQIYPHGQISESGKGVNKRLINRGFPHSPAFGTNPAPVKPTAEREKNLTQLGKQ